MVAELRLVEGEGPEPETARFVALQTWASDLGCCGMCSMAIAIAAVERESGRRWEPTHKCQKRDNRGVASGCMDLAKSHWTERPKR